MKHILQISNSRRRGFTLPVVLISISGLLILMTGALVLSKSSRTSTRSYQENFLLNLAIESAQEDALSMLSEGTNRNSFITHQNQDANGDPEYTLLSWFDTNASEWNHQPLFSNAPLETISVTAGNLDRYQPYTDIYNHNATHDPDTEIQLNGLRPKDSDPSQYVSFNAPKVPLKLDNAGNATISYSYWIEDLNGYLDYEALTFDDGDPDTPYEASLTLPGTTTPILTPTEVTGRADLKMLDQRHLSLNVFSSDAALATSEFPIDFASPFSPRKANPYLPSGSPPAPAHPFAKVFTTDTPAPYALTVSNTLTRAEKLSSSDQYDSMKHYLTSHLAETFELDVVPYGLNYPNAGTSLKANLNDFIIKADSLNGVGSSGTVTDPDIDDASSIDEVVTLLSQRLKNIPGFKDNDGEYTAAGITSGTNRSHTRYGGFPIDEESYTKTLAANIIDYADLDPNPTVERVNGASNYRGIDAMPFLTLATRNYTLTDTLSNNSGSITDVVLTVRTFLEIYNPSDQPISGYLKYDFTPHYTHHVTANSVDYPFPEETLYYWGGEIDLEPNQYKVIEVTTDNDGDFKGEVGIQGFPAFAIPSATTLPDIQRGDATSLNTCSISWFPSNGSASPASEEDFKEVCELNTRFRIEEGTIRLKISNSNNALYINNTGVGLPMHAEMTGDPRNTIYCRKSDGQDAINFRKNATFGGGNYYKTYQNGRYHPRVKFPDGANNHFYDTDQNNKTIGLEPPGSDSGVNSEYLPAENGFLHIRDTSEDPDTGMYITSGGTYLEQEYISDMTATSGFRADATYPTQTPQDKASYIQKISNQGNFFSLGELGHIYDPAQWRLPTRMVTYFHDDTPNDFTDATSGTLTYASKYADYGNTLHPTERDGSIPSLSELGGGMTLAIGSPEFNAFDPYAPNHDADSSNDYNVNTGGGREGYEGARLLDQFRVTESEVRSLKSRINLNTAPKKVLHALFGGFEHTSDQVLGDFTRQPLAYVSGSTTPDEELASGLVNGIINHRGNFPYRALSDISLSRGTTSTNVDTYLFGEKAFYEANIENANGFGIQNDIWSDEGREELFRRTNDLFTTQSRSYRIHMKAEHKKGDNIKVRTKTIDITIQPSYQNTPTLETAYDVNSSMSPKIIIHKTH